MKKSLIIAWTSFRNVLIYSRDLWIWDIGLFFHGILGYLCFLFWDMRYSGILGYGILEFIFEYELN